MVNRKAVLTACGACLGLVLAAAVSTGAWVNASRTTYVTFSGPVGLPGVTLGAGTYIFEMANPNRNDIVRVMSRQRDLVLFTGFTETVDRPANLAADHLISLGEAPPGVAPRVTVWYPAGDSLGHSFIYGVR